MYEGYQLHSQKVALKAAHLWEQLGCPYEQALALFEGTEADKRKALDIIDKLDATAVVEKMMLAPPVAMAELIDHFVSMLG